MILDKFYVILLLEGKSTERDSAETLKYFDIQKDTSIEKKAIDQYELAVARLKGADQTVNILKEVIWQLENMMVPHAVLADKIREALLALGEKNVS